MSAQAAVIFDLTCVLNTETCGFPSYGTVTLTNDGLGGVDVTVDLLGSNDKFKDLMLNYGGAATSFTSSDGSSIALGAFSISPYDGVFNLGVWTIQGPPVPDNFTFKLTGNVALDESDFLNPDSLGNYFVGIHVQDIGPNGCDGSGTPLCTPGVDGNGSIKLGGVEPLLGDEPVPEPATFVLAGAGLVLMGLLRRRRLKLDLAIE